MHLNLVGGECGVVGEGGAGFKGSSIEYGHAEGVNGVRGGAVAKPQSRPVEARVSSPSTSVVV